MPEQSSLERKDGRAQDELRSVAFELDFITYPEGSVLIKQGNTHVLCNVSVLQGVPEWMQAKGVSGGWITAEYAMLPRATHQRSPREIIQPNSRSQEIRRLIGRALRAGFHLERFPPLTCIADCDVLQADGGTRAAAVTGGYVALVCALKRVLPPEFALESVMHSQIAAISVGLLGESLVLDLDYEEDSSATADLNVVMDNAGGLIEVQGTAEQGNIPRKTFDAMLDIAQGGIFKLLQLQAESLRSKGIDVA